MQSVFPLLFQIPTIKIALETQPDGSRRGVALLRPEGVVCLSHSRKFGRPLCVKTDWIAALLTREDTKILCKSGRALVDPVGNTRITLGEIETAVGKDFCVYCLRTAVKTQDSNSARLECRGRHVVCAECFRGLVRAGKAGLRADGRRNVFCRACKGEAGIDFEEGF